MGVLASATGGEHGSLGLEGVLKTLCQECQLQEGWCEWIGCQLRELDQGCGCLWPVVSAAGEKWGPSSSSYWTERGCLLPATGAAVVCPPANYCGGVTGVSEVSVGLHTSSRSGAAGHSLCVGCQLPGAGGSGSIFCNLVCLECVCVCVFTSKLQAELAGE